MAGRKIMISHTVSHRQTSPFRLLSLGFVFGLGVITTYPTPLLAAGESFTTKQPIPQEEAWAYQAQAISPLSDGIYLYGQSPKTEQIGQEYLVFKVQQGKITGAFYMPRSEFSCFSGTLDAQQMRLSIVDPYDRSVYPYAITLRPLSPLAGQVSPSLGLEGYHQISAISENEQRILTVCLNE